MSARLAAAVAAVIACSVGLAPAHAATRPRTTKGSFPVTVAPNPTMEVTDELPGAKGCAQTVPGGRYDRPFTVPAAGKLTVTLDGEDATGGAAGAGPDWDLYVLDPDGTVREGSHGGTAHEQVFEKFKRKQKVVFSVCNLMGTPKATVSWTFTYA